MRTYIFFRSIRAVALFSAIALVMVFAFSPESFAKPAQKPAVPKIKVTPREDITWGTDANTSPSNNDRNTMDVHTNNRELDNGNNFNQPIIVAPEIQLPNNGGHPAYPSYPTHTRPSPKPHPSRPTPY